MQTPNPKASLGVLGAGAAACAACCAGPVLGFLAATGIASVLGAVVLCLVGLLVVLVGAALLYQRRRRKAQRCAATTGAVPVDAPKVTTASDHSRPLAPPDHRRPHDHRHWAVRDRREPLTS